MKTIAAHGYFTKPTSGAKIASGASSSAFRKIDDGVCSARQE
ncbi:hypothetical protein [Qipengyuania marisflavi]|nr:hypothetical protein [Qipengyuania marisflavi]